MDTPNDGQEQTEEYKRWLAEQECEDLLERCQKAIDRFNWLEKEDERIQSDNSSTS